MSEQSSLIKLMQFSANIMPNNRLSSPATSPGSASDQSVKTLEYRVYDVKTGIYIPACDKYVCSFQHGCLLILSLCKHALRAFTNVLWPPSLHGTLVVDINVFLKGSYVSYMWTCKLNRDL